MQNGPESIYTGNDSIGGDMDYLNPVELRSKVHNKCSGGNKSKDSSFL